MAPRSPSLWIPGPSWLSAIWRAGLLASEAIAAGLSIGDTGSLLPATEKMALSVDDLWEAYNIAYRPLSGSTHAGAHSFVNDELQQRRGGTHIASKPAWPPVALRAVGVTTIAVLMASVSRQIGMGIDADCDAIRPAVVFPDV